MSAFLGIVITLLILSWAYARDRGVPWMAWGTPTKIRTAKRQAQYRRLRTHSIKPRSPWLEPKQEEAPPEQQRMLRTRSIKPESPWLQGQINLPAAQAFTRLTELTRSKKVSDRLIRDNLRRNPDRNKLWAAEKAIYDIERDRMAR